MNNELLEAYRKLDVAVAALEYCAQDDPMAVTPEGTFDEGSANAWKRMRARETLEEIAPKNSVNGVGPTSRKKRKHCNGN